MSFQRTGVPKGYVRKRTKVNSGAGPTQNGNSVKIFSVWLRAGDVLKHVMNEIFARVWENLYARFTGPMNLRLIIQPTVATILAIRAGLRDAQQNREPFLWAALWKPGHRRELLRQGWKDVGKVFLLATILDVVYQLIVHRGVYILELLITAVTLAIIPYVLVRGPISRVAKMLFAARSAMKQPSVQ
jgi:hypothetical protein